MHIDEEKLNNLEHITRINIINAITGIKPGNLVGTQSQSGDENLAIMSSCIHLGSKPALIGLILRPQEQTPTSTYLNIKDTGSYTINHIPNHLTCNAHFTSAKFPMGISEFEECNLTPEYKAGFKAPFVKESPLKIGLKFVQEMKLEINKTVLVIGEVKHIEVPDNMVNKTGQIDLEALGSTGISGLDHYYKMVKIADYPYAHLEDVPKFKS